jgi:hypothetical protein
MDRSSKRLAKVGARVPKRVKLPGIHGGPDTRSASGRIVFPLHVDTSSVFAVAAVGGRVRDGRNREPAVGQAGAEGLPRDGVLVLEDAPVLNTAVE